MNPALSVIMPCYNEGGNIPLLIKRFRQVIPQRENIELVLVNNGSTDNTKEVLSTARNKHPFLHIVTVEKNIGYGFGIWSGIKAARGDYICWTHADMQTDIKDALIGFELIKKQSDPKKCFVKGSRKKRAFIDGFFTLGMSVFETMLLRKRLSDINAQPNLFHKSFLRHIHDPPKDFSFDLFFYYMAKKLNYTVIRFPVDFSTRIHGESSWNTGIFAKWKFIKRTIRFTLEMKKYIIQEDD